MIIDRIGDKHISEHQTRTHGHGKWDLFVKAFVPLCVLTALSACGGADGGQPNAEIGEAPTATPRSASYTSTLPPPVAQLTLDNGNHIDFYDLDSGGAVLIESGVHYSPQRLTPEHRRSSYADVWKAFKADVPVPQTLIKLDAKQKVRAEQAQRMAGREGLQTQAAPLERTQLLSAAKPYNSPDPVGCNNGCCDYDWLSTFYQCVWSYGRDPDLGNLFNYNYGYSDSSYGTLSQDFANQWYHFACSAEGTSVFHSEWNCFYASHNVTYNVSEATWIAPSNTCWYGANGYTTVNSWNNQHLHTYCYKAWD